MPNVKDVMTSIKLQLAAADHRGAVQADAGGFQQEVAGVGADQDHSQAGRGAGGGGRGAARHRGEEGQEEEEVSGEVCSDNNDDEFLMMVMIRWVRGGGKKLKEESRGEMSDIPEVGTFAWLDKELQKVNREKTRLERERLKTAEVR